MLMFLFLFFLGTCVSTNLFGPPCESESGGKKKILWINPVGTNVFDEQISDFINTKKDPSTQVQVYSLTRGPMHLEYHFYEALVAADTLAVIRKAEAECYNATIIGCFYDPFLHEAREIAEKMVVVAPAEASLHIATTLGHKFSIIVGRQKWIPKMEGNVFKYGFHDKLASIKHIGLGVHDFQKDHEETARRMREAAREAIEEDGAEVIILGCTIEFGFYETLQDELGVPVIDVVLASLKYAEMLVSLKQGMGWSHSKKYAYESPPSSELEEWKLLEQYSEQQPILPSFATGFSTDKDEI